MEGEGFLFYRFSKSYGSQIAVEGLTEQGGGESVDEVG